MIILDEPTAGINNPSDSRCVFECIAAWRRDFPDKTIIISNHDSRLFGTLPGDSRILGLDAELGELTQDETLDQARENLDAPFAQLFNE
jgi:ABC-type branched-subunit amino acid transport system ATPase component